MKVSLPQDQLSRGLAIVGRGVASAARSTLPITSNILLATDEGRLRLSATDLEIAINLWLPAMVEEEGATTVPARLFTEHINSLPNDRVDLSQTDDAFTLFIACARTKAHVRGIDPDEFPLIPTVSEQSSASVPASLLKTMIAQVVFTAATDDTRPVFTGVLASFTGESLTLAAADGYRLSVRSAALSQSAGAFSVIIPARTLAELARILPDGDDPVEITVTPNRSQVLFHTGTLDVISRLIEGEYVRYQQIIPRTHTVRAVVSVADWSKATKTASLYARDSNNIVRLSLDPGEGGETGLLTITANAADVGDNVSQIDAVIEGDALTVGFNVKYISEVLAVLGSGTQVALELGGPAQPGVVKPLDGTDYLHVMMPMSIPR